MLFLHPHYGIPSEMYGEAQNGHVLPLALGFPFETTIAVSRMILSGIFDRHPDLKILLAHSGKLSWALIIIQAVLFPSWLVGLILVFNMTHM